MSRYEFLQKKWTLILLKQFKKNIGFEYLKL